MNSLLLNLEKLKANICTLEQQNLIGRKIDVQDFSTIGQFSEEIDEYATQFHLDINSQNLIFYCDFEHYCDFSQLKKIYLCKSYLGSFGQTSENFERFFIPSFKGVYFESKISQFNDLEESSFRDYLLLLFEIVKKHDFLENKLILTLEMANKVNFSGYLMNKY